MDTRYLTTSVFAVALLAAALLPAGIASAQEAAAAAEVAYGADEGGGIGTDVLTRPPRGSLAAQLRLKLRLQMSSGGMSLTSSLDHNRAEWNLLSPEQRERFRGMAVAFLDKDPKEQEQLLKRYNEFMALDQQKRAAYKARAKWVRAVVATFTIQQRKQLEAMSSKDRARAIIARRDKLVREGKLVLEDPTTRPAGGVDTSAPPVDANRMGSAAAGE